MDSNHPDFPSVFWNSQVFCFLKSAVQSALVSCTAFRLPSSKAARPCMWSRTGPGSPGLTPFHRWRSCVCNWPEVTTTGGCVSSPASSFLHGCRPEWTTLTLDARSEAGSGCGEIPRQDGSLLRAHRVNLPRTHRGTDMLQGQAPPSPSQCPNTATTGSWHGSQSGKREPFSL